MTTLLFLDLKMTNFVVSSRFKNQHSGRCTRFCHPKMSNFPSGCSKTTKWVTESTNGCSKTTKRVTESTNGDLISTQNGYPKIQNGVRQLYGVKICLVLMCSLAFSWHQSTSFQIISNSNLRCWDLNPSLNVCTYTPKNVLCNNVEFRKSFEAKNSDIPFVKAQDWHFICVTLPGQSPVEATVFEWRSLQKGS